MKNSKFLMILVVCLMTIRCFGQKSGFIKIENIGISPPSLPTTMIIKETSFYNKTTRIADFFIVNEKEFRLLRKFIINYNNLRAYQSSSMEFGVLEISIGLRVDTTESINKKYFTESRLRSGFFLEDLSIYLSQHHGDSRLLKRINYLLKEVN